MSLILTPTPAPTPSTAPPSPPGRNPGRVGIGLRVALAVALLAGSGLYRLWRQGGIDSAMRSGRVCPIRLADLPMQLGPWEGQDDTLDPHIARTTGASDYIFRTYTNRLTGVRLSLIALYGPSELVFIHLPETCYKAAGYAQTEGPQVETVRIEQTADAARKAGQDIPFYGLTFAKGEGGQSQHQRVYYTWGVEGEWSPAVLSQKRAARIPGLFKIHVDRPALPQERLQAGDPCEDFLGLLMSEIVRRLDEAHDARAAAARS